MSRRSAHRLTTTLLVALSLLFAQLALANYVCPGKTDTAAMAEMMASGEPCEGMDPVQPSLCHQHATGPAQTSEVVKLPAASQPAIVQVVVLPAVLDAEMSAAAPIAASSEARPPPGPIFLSTLRLRV